MLGRGGDDLAKDHQLHDRRHPDELLFHPLEFQRPLGIRLSARQDVVPNLDVLDRAAIPLEIHHQRRLRSETRNRQIADRPAKHQAE
jgi:hypothetical protein